jgi:hypothetical protein
MPGPTENLRLTGSALDASAGQTNRLGSISLRIIGPSLDIKPDAGARG